MNISQRRLHYLYESARLGTMRAAGEKLNVAPSSISRQIAELESELGTPLIERGRRRLKLTEAGELAYQYYRDRCAQQEAFISHVKELQSLSTGKISIAVGEAFISDRFSDTLQQFMQRFPGISVRVAVSNTSEVVRMVSDDEAHFGMIFDTSPDPKVRSRISLPQPMKVIVHRRHPLASHAIVHLADLGNYCVGLLDGAYRMRQLIEQSEQEQGIFFTPHLATSSLALLRGFIKSGSGVSLLPDLVVQAELAEELFVSIPTDSATLNATQISLITRVGRQLPIAAFKFMQYLENYFRQLNPPSLSAPQATSPKALPRRRARPT